jgi:hypothetical protein
MSVRRCRLIALLAAAALARAVPADAGDLLSELATFLGISATPGQMKGPDGAAATGDIWAADVRRDERRPLTTDGGYRWPIFDPKESRIVALRRNDILEIPLNGGQPRVLLSVPGIEKVIGFDRTSRVLALMGTAATQVVVVSLTTGELTALTYDPRSPADRALLAHLRGEERAYGATTLYVEAQTKIDLTGALLGWTDVFIKEPGKPPRNSADAMASIALSRHCPPTQVRPPSSRPRSRSRRYGERCSAAASAHQGSVAMINDVSDVRHDHRFPAISS